MQALADELSRRLGRDRCWKVRWPALPPISDAAVGLDEALPDGSAASSEPTTSQQPRDANGLATRKDANEVLLKDGHEVVRQCLAAAEAYPIRGLFR